jgi:hypothetical protein
MGIWIELGVFLLVFVFAAWQFHDLRQARAEREGRERAKADSESPSPSQSDDLKP